MKYRVVYWCHVGTLVSKTTEDIIAENDEKATEEAKRIVWYLECTKRLQKDEGYMLEEVCRVISEKKLTTIWKA